VGVGVVATDNGDGTGTVAFHGAEATEASEGSVRTEEESVAATAIFANDPLTFPPKVPSKRTAGKELPTMKNKKQKSQKKPPTNAKLAPKEAPANAKLAPKEAPANAKLAPKEAPANAKLAPKEAKKLKSAEDKLAKKLSKKLSKKEDKLAKKLEAEKVAEEDKSARDVQDARVEQEAEEAKEKEEKEAKEKEEKGLQTPPPQQSSQEPEGEGEDGSFSEQINQAMPSQSRATPVVQADGELVDTPIVDPPAKKTRVVPKTKPKQKPVVPPRASGRVGTRSQGGNKRAGKGYQAGYPL
jgi:hypothetical protein